MIGETLSYHSSIIDLLLSEMLLWNCPVNQQISKLIESGNKGSSEVLSDAMGTAKEIVTLTEYFPKCESIFWEVKDNVESEEQEDLNDSRKDGLLSPGPEKFFLPGSKNKFSKFPAEQLQNCLQLEALYSMFVTPLKSSDYIYILY